jgi:monooxygenase
MRRILQVCPRETLGVGYFQASWTLKADLIAGYVARIIQKLLAAPSSPSGFCVPRAGSEIEIETAFSERGPGYQLRSRHLAPKHGTAEPWVVRADYLPDREMYLNSTLEDGCLHFEGGGVGQPQLVVSARL